MLMLVQKLCLKLTMEAVDERADKLTVTLQQVGHNHDKQLLILIIAAATSHHTQMLQRWQCRLYTCIHHVDNSTCKFTTPKRTSRTFSSNATYRLIDLPSDVPPTAEQMRKTQLGLTSSVHGKFIASRYMRQSAEHPRTSYCYNLTAYQRSVQVAGARQVTTVVLGRWTTVNNVKLNGIHL
jgi:hypothetical protein